MSRYYVSAEIRATVDADSEDQAYASVITAMELGCRDIQATGRPLLKGADKIAVSEASPPSSLGVLPCEIT